MASDMQVHFLGDLCHIVNVRDLIFRRKIDHTLARAHEVVGGLAHLP